MLEISISNITKTSYYYGNLLLQKSFEDVLHGYTRVGILLLVITDASVSSIA